MIYVVRVELDVDYGKEDLLYFEDTLNVIYTSKPTYDDLVTGCIQGFFSDVEKEFSKDYEKYKFAMLGPLITSILPTEAGSISIGVPDMDLCSEIFWPSTKTKVL